ncbi:MAG: hypothetical protein IJS03_06965 [Eubacterium sp.]|nr:hypothetical protein [Eubacterium sp.]
MKKCFIAPDSADKRIPFAVSELEKMGNRKAEKADNADFVLLGVNQKPECDYKIPVFAGNVKGENVFDYTKDEEFVIKNAALTAEGAISLAISESDITLINSRVLITGFGRIGKTLLRYTEPFTKDITVCARSDSDRASAENTGAALTKFELLKYNGDYDFIFNTVPHPVFNEAELKAVNKDAVLIELASFPGGIDRHFAKHYGLKLIDGKALPSRYSKKSAGILVAKAVDKMAREVLV